MRGCKPRVTKLLVTAWVLITIAIISLARFGIVIENIPEQWISTTSTAAPIYTLYRFDSACEPEPLPFNNSAYNFSFTGGAPCPPNTDILLLIKSSIYRNDLRRAIETNWARSALIQANGSTVRIEVRFLVGSGLQNDSISDETTIKGSFEDTFKSVLLKAFMGIRWANVSCQSAKIVAICDDDVELLPWNLVSWYQSLDEVLLEKSDFYGGTAVIRGAAPFRGQHRYALSIDTIRCARFPDYISGSAIIFNRNSLEKFLRVGTPYTPEFYFDDVYFGYLAKKLKIRIGYSELKSDWDDCSLKIANNTRLMGLLVFCHNSDEPELSDSLFAEICVHSKNSTYVTDSTAFDTYCTQAMEKYQ